jgi:valyl-tRNA synthetase
MLSNRYNAAEVEADIYKCWEESRAFACRPDGGGKPYTILMPPPNVTGSLHMGHALTFTLQDILIRYHRMKGRDALWQPGTDHAGIATQMVVERELAQEKTDRHRLGREKFVERVWQWKEQSGSTITRQLRALGASPDWSRERFTMDEGLSAAVRKMFVRLYREGLIYRDKRLVNWDPVLHTGISDLEVENIETKGSLWYIRYPVEGGGEHIVVATTRPETMLGDTGIAVHPEDERYRHLIGRHVVLPLVGRRIPIVADEYADPTTGSGAVKITPAHDFNDFEVGRRHDLPLINIFDRDARLNDEVPEAYRGLDRFDARKKIVADLEGQGLLDRIESHALTVPHGDRSGAVIEPWLTDQWYCDAKTLARPAIEAVERGRTVFVPRQWENTFFEWMRNIQPWCISRQLWWGHQIPAWYAEDGRIFVAETEEEAHAQAGVGVALERDPDVLDTWFSSALWPFSTLGWPDETPELKRYYPSDVLVTGFDIIFFWVARMMMMSLHVMNDVPFRDVYIHALVRDERGQKMSKSKGNIIDPLVLIDKYGTDALRFTLTALASQGRDIKLSESRVEGYRNFVTKLWNAARYAELNECRLVADFDPAACTLTVNRWIVAMVAGAADAVSILIGQYMFDAAANELYHFVWDTFCDWYVEFTKPILTSDKEAAKAETRATTAWALAQIVRLLHPIMPFVTEALWREWTGGPNNMLIDQRWPEFDASVHRSPFREALEEMEWVTALIAKIREVRAEMNIPGATELPTYAKLVPEKLQWIGPHLDQIKRLARLKAIEFITPAAKMIQIGLDGAEIFLDAAGAIDLDQERARLAKEKSAIESELGKIAQKLGNAQFIAKAKPEAIEEQRERQAEKQGALVRVGAALARLGA